MYEVGDAEFEGNTNYQTSNVFMREFFCIFCKLQRINKLLKLTINDVIEVIHGKAYTMIGNSALREIIGSDFCRPVAGTHQAFSVPGNFFLLFAHLFFIQTGTQHLHGFFAVAQLRAFGLAHDYRSGGYMR